MAASQSSHSHSHSMLPEKTFKERRVEEYNERMAELKRYWERRRAERDVAMEEGDEEGARFLKLDMDRTVQIAEEDHEDYTEDVESWKALEADS
jgi:phosphopantetheine adenylyltransferase